MTINKYILALTLAFCCTVGNLFAVEKSYYNSLDGKRGTALREALTNLVYTHHTTDLGYNWTFDGIDIVNGEVLDIYSTCTWSSGQQGKSYSGICDGYNREHVVPQSVFDEKAPQVSDRHHLFLVDGMVNNKRSSYPFGETNTTTAFSSYSNGNKALGKFGASSSGFTGSVYEPDDEYKGDIARAIMYMAIRYATADVCKKYGGTANSYPVTTWSNAMFSGNLSANYGLSANAVAMYMKWHRADPPSAKEIARNNGVEAKQGNRNPFVDLPDLAEYLWGTHTSDAVNLSSLTLATGGGSVATPYEIILNRNGVTQTVTCTGTYTLPTASSEEDACDGWIFKGWTASTYNNTIAPTYVTSVSSATTLYAVYGSTSSSAPRLANTTDTWVLVTDSSTLKSGDVLVIASNASGATAGDISNQIMGSVTSTFSSGDDYATITALGSSTIELTLGGSAGRWTLSNGNSQLLGATAAKKLAWGSGTTTWSIRISSGAATIQNGTSSYGRFLYNTDSPRFTTYTSDVSSKMLLPQLYRKTTSGGGGSTTTYKTSPDCGTAHTITLSNGGSVTGGEFWANTSTSYSGATITLNAEPNDGYTFGSWTVTTASGGSVTVTSNQFTMPDADVTVSASFTENQKHTIRFYNNGSVISTQSVHQGSMPNVPADPEGCDGYTFVGWWTSALAADNTASKTWTTDFTVSDAQDYYAIFSKTETSGSGSSIITLKASEDTSFPTKGITLSTSNGVLNNGTDYRIYKGATLTITSTVGKMSTIALTYTKASEDGGGWASSYSPNATTWTSPATTSGSSGEQARITQIVITIASSGTSTTYYTSTTNCASACTALETPAVTAVGSNGQITLTWADVADADHYTVAISKGAGYTTECGSTHSIGTISHSGTTNTCVITGLTNGLNYTASVVANAASATCDSEAGEASATPTECNDWTDPTLTWSAYQLSTTGTNTATLTVSGTSHGTLSFESGNTDVLTVASNGTVTAVGAGTATVTAHWTAADGYCEKTMTSQAFEVAGPLTINFDANGGTGTMTDQTVTYKVSTAIKDNSFTRTGYTFQGWALTADGDKVYNDKQSVAFTNSQTLYAVWLLNSHDVTFTPSLTGATLTINDQSSSPQSVAYGSTVTLHITPAEHYTVSALTVSGTSGSVAVSGTGDTRTFTMPDEAVTVSLTMAAESQYSATFYNGATAFATVTGYVDDDIAAPSGTPAACDDETFTFVGWVATEQSAEDTSHPELLTFPQVMPSGGASYYALFRRTEGGEGGEATVSFKTASSDSGTECTTDSDIKSNLVSSSTGITSFEGSKVYLGKNGMKLGTGSYAGSITLNLSSPITTDKIIVDAVKYGTDGGELKIDVNGSTAFGSAMSPADGMLEFTHDDAIEISNLTVYTTTKRAYISYISLGGGGTSYYTTAPECAACEYQVTIIKGTEEHGRFTLSKADGSYDNCKNNVSVTVSDITPDDGYYCTGVTATGSHMNMSVSGPDAGGNYTVAYARDHSVTSTITANFEEIPTYTVTWSVLGGEESSSATYHPGDDITFPADHPTGCEGKEFVGWTTESILLTDDEPTLVSSATMGTSDITYYAVFATASEGAPTLTNNYKKITSTSELTDGNYLIVAYFNGYNAMSTTWKNTYYLASKTVTPNNDIITTTDGTIIWNIAVSNDQTTIYNETSKYLYIEKSISNNKTYYNIKLGNNTTDNKFTYSVSDGDWLFTSVTYTDRVLEYYTSSTRWAYYTAADAPVYLYKQQYAAGATTYSGYTTLCYEKYERTFNNVEDYATLCLPYSVNVLYLQGATAYSVAGKYVNNSTITGILLNEEETELAAGQSYVIQSTALTMNAWYSPRVDSLKAPVDTQGMVGNLSGKKIYVPVGCYGLSHNKLRKVASENTASIDHYKAYFILNDDEEVPVVEESTIPQGSKVMRTTDDAPTALEQTNGQPSIDWNQPVYNILGIRVGKDATGVLIQNGIKYLR